jgi:protein-S-isoprenylcysteine O-methyltransferase Ste14
VDPTILIRALGLYVPLLLACALGWLMIRTQRQVAALLAGVCWCLCSLLLLQVFNEQVLWWKFHATGGLLHGMPVDMFLGWTVLWGVLPLLILPRASVWIVLGIFFLLDLALMPACRPVVELSPRWLQGEAVALLLVLLPAVLFSRWSNEGTHLAYRSSLWAVTASSLLLFFVPDIFFASSGHGGWHRLFAMSSFVRNLGMQILFLLAVPAFSAVQEFARRGRGTPIPYDPPRRLVTSGLYRYVANPMQTSGVLVFATWAILLREPWLLGGALTIVVYCVGLAAWHEGQDMERRLGAPWIRYRRNVNNWRPRWLPWHDPEAIRPRLYIAENCGQCSEVRRWLEARRPAGLQMVAAEDHPTHNLYRMTYDPLDGSLRDEGVAAFARGLEHLNFAWAYAGALLRLPVIGKLIQLLLDASGLGPQLIERRACKLG